MMHSTFTLYKATDPGREPSLRQGCRDPLGSSTHWLLSLAMHVLNSRWQQLCLAGTPRF